MRVSSLVMRHMDRGPDFWTSLEARLKETLSPSDNGKLPNQWYAPRIPVSASREYLQRLDLRRSHTSRLLADHHFAPLHLELFGEEELDLIDYIYGGSATAYLPRMLYVVGPIGCGKSTFFRHIFGWAERCLSPRFRFPALVIDFARLNRTKSDLDKWLVEQVHAAARNELFARANADDEHLQPKIAREALASWDTPPSTEAVAAIPAMLRSLERIGMSTILVLDNVDQHPRYVIERVSSLADAISRAASEDRFRVCVGIRPFNYRHGGLLGRASKGALLHCVLSLDSPPLVQIFHRRVGWLRDQYPRELRRVSVSIQESVRVLAEDAEQFLTFVLKSVETVEYADLLDGISSRNIRVALQYLIRILSFRRINAEYFATHVHGRKRMHKWTMIPNYIGMQALMLQEYNCYSAEQSERTGAPPIYTIFQQTSGNDPDGLWCPAYLCLAILNSHGVDLPVPFVLQELEIAGLQPADAANVVKHLLARALLDSPDLQSGVPADLAEARSVSISHAGKYYLQELAGNADYLSWTCMDLDLPGEHLESALARFRQAGFRGSSVQDYSFDTDPLLVRLLVAIAANEYARTVEERYAERIRRAPEAAFVFAALKNRWPHALFHKAVQDTTDGAIGHYEGRDIDTNARLVRLRAILSQELRGDITWLGTQGGRADEAANFRRLILASDDRTSIEVTLPDFVSCDTPARATIRLTSAAMQEGSLQPDMCAVMGAEPDRVEVCNPAATLVRSMEAGTFVGGFSFIGKKPGKQNVSFRVLANGRTAAIGTVGLLVLAGQPLASLERS